MVCKGLHGGSSSSATSPAAPERSGARPGACCPPASSRDFSRSGPSGTEASFCEQSPAPARAPSWRSPPSLPGGASETWTPLGSCCSSCSWSRTGAWPSCCWTPLQLVSPHHHQSSCLRYPVRTSSAARWWTLTWGLWGGKQTLGGSWWPGSLTPQWPSSASRSESGCWSSPPGCLQRWAPALLWSSPGSLHTEAPSLVSSAFGKWGNVAWRCSVWLWLQQDSYR